MPSPRPDPEETSTRSGVANAGPLLCFVGPCPPPVHGKSIATRNMLDLLRARNFVVEVAGVRNGKGPRAVREIAAAWNIIRSPAHALYLVVNGNLGLLYTLLHSAAGRLSGKRLSLHHHSFRYIGRHDWLMGTLAIVAGRSATHITNCPAMSRQLEARYPRIGKTLSYSNVGSVPADLKPSDRRAGTFTLGHLSNLTEEKGIGRVVDAFRFALGAGKDVRLVVAGPTADAFSERVLAEAHQEFGDRITYSGPVFGDQKAAFFRSIDLFLFPSRYPTETQGIVNLEALAAGKPVIAFDQCCIGEDIGSDGGRAIAADEDFSRAVVDYLDLFASDPGGASRRARARFETLLGEYEVEVRRLVEHLGGSVSPPLASG